MCVCKCVLGVGVCHKLKIKMQTNELENASYLVYDGQLVHGQHRHFDSNGKPLENRALTDELQTLKDDILEKVSSKTMTDEYWSWIENDASLDPIIEELIPILKKDLRGKKALTKRVLLYKALPHSLLDIASSSSSSWSTSSSSEEERT